MQVEITRGRNFPLATVELLIELYLFIYKQNACSDAFFFPLLYLLSYLSIYKAIK